MWADLYHDEYVDKWWLLVNVSFVKKESRVHYIVIHFSKQHVGMLQICGHVLLIVDQLSLICYAFWFLSLSLKKKKEQYKQEKEEVKYQILIRL